MNLSEVAILLGTVTSYDLRIEVSELKVRAWHESLDSEMPLRDAQNLVYWYYSNFENAISPSVINREYRRRKNQERERHETEKFFKELEIQASQKAKPEAVQRYLEEIRSTLGKSKNASVDSDTGEMASDL